jgi:hypothetical protein
LLIFAIKRGLGGTQSAALVLIVNDKGLDDVHDMEINLFMLKLRFRLLGIYTVEDAHNRKTPLVPIKVKTPCNYPENP